jgi:hypothetical protein
MTTLLLHYLFMAWCLSTRITSYTRPKISPSLRYVTEIGERRRRKERAREDWVLSASAIAWWSFPYLPVPRLAGQPTFVFVTVSVARRYFATSVPSTLHPTIIDCNRLSQHTWKYLTGQTSFFSRSYIGYSYSQTFPVGLNLASKHNSFPGYLLATGGMRVWVRAPISPLYGPPPTLQQPR